MVEEVVETEAITLATADGQIVRVISKEQYDRWGQWCQYTGCERYCRPFLDTNINLHKIFENNNSLIKLSGIVYLYIDLTFSR